MCGICGLTLANGSRPSRSIIERMCATIVHRGPDDQGIYLADSVALGHRRLSIVDLGGGHQPMPNEDDSAWIIFNGEIYNHAELRQPLIARGHRYRTASDTESILHLYEEGGPQAFRDLRGMFAFALWDSRRHTLVLARDHSGIKPLFYALTPAGDLVFGSEVKALFASEMLNTELEIDLVPEYFATGHVSGERTLLRGIRKLLPGHWLTWQRGSVQVGRFWSLTESASQLENSVPDRMPDAAREFWRRFRESVRLQLMSDVPLGAFLSGGLDSSLIVAAMRELDVPEIQTFSVGYPEQDSNELPVARAAAAVFKTRHHEVRVGAAEFLGALPGLTQHRDFPLTFPASIPLAAVAGLAQPHVKVVLTGEGSDELFAGYGRYPRALFNLRWARRLDRWLPFRARSALRSAFAQLGDGFVSSRIRRSFLGQEGSAVGAFLEPYSDFTARDRRRLFERETEPFERVAQLLDRGLFERDPLEALLRLDQQTYLEELLMKQDTMSMAASIESRVPYLDHTMRQWAALVPSDLKLQGWTGKAVVRAAARSRLPAEIIEAGKRGFPVPLATWLREPLGRELLATYAAGDLTAAGISPEYPRRLLTEHARGRDHSAKLWRLLAFGVWLQTTLPSLRALSRSPSETQLTSYSTHFGC
jgi:asparagine synthase (glutamine-hydrolysing)